MAIFVTGNCRPTTNVSFFSAAFFPVSITFTNSPRAIYAPIFSKKHIVFQASIACWKTVGDTKSWREWPSYDRVFATSAITFSKHPNPKNFVFRYSLPDRENFGRIPAEGLLSSSCLKTIAIATSCTDFESHQSLKNSPVRDAASYQSQFLISPAPVTLEHWKYRVSGLKTIRLPSVLAVGLTKSSSVLLYLVLS